MTALNDMLADMRSEIDRLRAALQKAEAERDERKAGNLMFMSQIHKVLNRMDPGDPNDGILTRLNRAADRLDSERARADRYLAAMTEYVDVTDVKEIESAYAAIRALVEEARRAE